MTKGNMTKGEKIGTTPDRPSPQDKERKKKVKPGRWPEQKEKNSKKSRSHGSEALFTSRQKGRDCKKKNIIQGR